MDRNSPAVLGPVEPSVRPLAKAYELAERLDNEWSMLLPEARREAVSLIAELLDAALNGDHAEEIERLSRDCGEALQVIGAGMFDEPCEYTQTDVERALDNLAAAVNGEPRPHDDLLPWPAA